MQHRRGQTTAAHIPAATARRMMQQQLAELLTKAVCCQRALAEGRAPAGESYFAPDGSRRPLLAPATHAIEWLLVLRIAPCRTQ